MFGFGKKTTVDKPPPQAVPGEMPADVDGALHPSAHEDSNQTKVPTWWASSSPTARVVVSFLALFALAAVPSFFIMNNDQSVKPVVQPNNRVTDSHLIVPTRRDITLNSIDGLTERVMQQEQTLQNIAKTMGEIQKNQVAMTEQRGQQPFMAEELTAQVKQLSDELARLKASGVGTGPAPNLNTPLTPPKPSASTPESPPAAKLRTIGEKKTAANTAEVGTDTEIETLLPGAMFEGILINGMDAPTSQVTQRNPVPVLMRVKTDAVLPNLYQAGVRECFVIMAGYGVLATERAMIRSEKMSCIRENGRPLDVKLDAYLVGEDGKVGLRGRLVSKQGQIIAKSLMAGMIDGLGKAATPSTTQPISIGSGGITTGATPGFNDIARAGVLGGVSAAASQTAKFYLDMANQMFPVVEIDAGRRATLIVLSSIQLADAAGNSRQ